MPNKRLFLNYIHQFRGFAILLIVGVHTLSSIPWIGNLYAKNLIFSITNNGTVLFVFIAGFLFYYLCHEKFNYFEYLRKKVKYVILPYIIISIPAIIDKLYFDNGSHWWMKDGFMDQEVWLKILIMLSTGRHSGILWFIPMIAIFYLLSFLFIRFSKQRAFNLIVPLLIVAGMWTFQFGYYARIDLSFIHFLPVYLMGMWIAKFKDQFFQQNSLLIWILGAAYLIISILEITGFISLSHLIELRDQNTLSLAFNTGKLKATIFCLFLLGLFRLREGRPIRLLERTGNDSFGIFFLHLYCINVFQILFSSGFLYFSGLNTLSYLLYTSIVVSLCLIVIFSLKRIFKSNSRLIIGS